jgi:uncharacterized membrane protein YedE/YeeE
MRKAILFLLVAIVATNSNAQTILYNGPESLLPNSTGQYSSIELPLGLTVTWSISANGLILGTANTA